MRRDGCTLRTSIRKHAEKNIMTKRKTKKAQLEEMTEKFRLLGVERPERWARTQVVEGIPLLTAMLFLKLMWRTIVKEGDAQWIDRDIAYAETHPDEPFIGGALALKTLRAKGATDEELIDLVRNYQMEYLWDIVMLLDFPDGHVEDYEPSFKEENKWAVVEKDDDENVTWVMGSLHELVMALDPTGRSGRMRGWVNK